MTIEYQAFRGSKQGVVEAKVTKSELGEHEVLVKISHSGLCGTDQHFMEADMVLGHEGIGTIEEVGPNVNLVKKGDRVGLSYFHYACNQCIPCLQGNDNYCEKRDFYGVGQKDSGSFASHAVWREDFVFPIPDDLASENAAPLMCAGATVFSAIDQANLKTGDKVGIIGVGGLGHLAIQFASKMGYEVAVFSGTDSKKEEAMKLGAKEFYAMKDRDSLTMDKPVNLLLATASAMPDWKLYSKVLAPFAIITPLAVSSDPFSINSGLVTRLALRVHGCMLGSRSVIKRMLHFAATHDIKPIIEKFPMNESGIKEASQKLTDGKMRYRGVLHRL